MAIFAPARQRLKARFKGRPRAGRPIWHETPGVRDDNLSESAMPISAQSPPPLLQIVTERLRPGAKEAYGVIEEELLHACRTLSAPNRYLAMVSLDQPTDVWWLNMYDSYADVDRVAAAYASNTTLMTALRELSAKKTGLTEPPIDAMTSLRRDLSGDEAWQIGELQFAAVSELRAPAALPGALFEWPDGRACSLIAAPDLDSAKHQARRLGDGARILEVEPRWSLPQDAWVLRNPKLWRPATPST